MVLSLCTRGYKIIKGQNCSEAVEEYKLSFPHSFTIHLPSKRQMTLFAARITFNLVILFLIPELKMETIYHCAPLKKRLMVFFF